MAKEGKVEGDQYTGFRARQPGSIPIPVTQELLWANYLTPDKMI